MNRCSTDEFIEHFSTTASFLFPSISIVFKPIDLSLILFEPGACEALFSIKTSVLSLSLSPLFVHTKLRLLNGVI